MSARQASLFDNNHGLQFFVYGAHITEFLNVRLPQALV